MRKSFSSSRARASDYIRPFFELTDAERANGVLLGSRVSPSNSVTLEENQRILANYEKHLREKVSALGIEIHGYAGDVASGWDWDDRPELDRLAEQARLQNCPILFPTTNRILRNREFAQSYRQPDARDFERLKQRYPDVVFATLLDPDASESEMAKYLSAIGKRFPKPKRDSNRGRKISELDQRQIDWSKLCWGLFVGRSRREIARQIGRSESTLRDWLKPRELMTAPPPLGRPKKKQNSENITVSR